jgi:hypothetical protein
VQSVINPNINVPPAVIIDLLINEHEYTFDDWWNDYIIIQLLNLNVNNQYTDIYIQCAGTDIDGHGFIYRYDGEKIYRYADFRVSMGVIGYDGNGYIYHIDWYEDDGYALYVFDVESKESNPVQ